MSFAVERREEKGREDGKGKIGKREKNEKKVNIC